MEHLMEELTVFYVDVVIFILIAIPGIIAYNVMKRLDKKRDRKRGRVKYLAKIKEGEVT